MLIKICLIQHKYFLNNVIISKSMRHYYTIPGPDFQEITPARKCHSVMMSNCKLFDVIAFSRHSR